MNINAIVKRIRYCPYLCPPLSEVPVDDLETGFDQHTSFIVALDRQNKLALSWWVSAKRTRSYPYARVYDTLSFSGKKVTIIPVYKDEGYDGDRDYLQWDTVSLMSLLGIYVIIGYYQRANPSKRFAHKITDQRFDIQYIREKIAELRTFQSDALHWNLLQCEKIEEVARRALQAYRQIARTTGVKMHSEEAAIERIAELAKGAEHFKNLSRSNARQAQKRETITHQPKEFVEIEKKASLTISNYLGGRYYFTADEAWVESNRVFLAECKHSRRSVIPSWGDIKDGLIKMALFCNLEDVAVDGVPYSPSPVLRLTSSCRKDKSFISNQKVQLLLQEAEENKFCVQF